MNIENSKTLFHKSETLAPAGVHSPVRAFQAVGGTPLFFDRGKGAHIWDVDGNSYIDFCMCWGALSLGHSHPQVISAIQEQAIKGTHFGTPTTLDVELAEMILESISPFEKIRFVNSGTEAVMTAMRLARGYTGKTKIIKINGAYHGHTDSLLVSAGSGLATHGISSSAGVPQFFTNNTLIVPFNDELLLKETFEKYGEDIAAIIIEPVMANNGLFQYSPSYIHLCRDLTKKYSSLFLFDEVITGFRVGKEGARTLYDVQPDIGTYGKIIGGGLPIGAIAASSEIMDYLAPLGPVYQAGTLSGNPLAMTSGLATLKEMKKNNYYKNIETLGTYLDQKVKKLKNFYYKRIGGIFWFCTDKDPKSPDNIPPTIKETYRHHYHHLLSQGIYLPPSPYEVLFLSSAHTVENIDSLLNALQSANEKLGLL